MTDENQDNTPCLNFGMYLVNKGDYCEILVECYPDDITLILRIWDPKEEKIHDFLSSVVTEKEDLKCLKIACMAALGEITLKEARGICARLMQEANEKRKQTT